MRKLIYALLTDENGISEKAYNALVEYLEDMVKFTGGTHAEWVDMLAEVKRADATDGRFYFPEN